MGFSPASPLPAEKLASKGFFHTFSSLTSHFFLTAFFICRMTESAPQNGQIFVYFPVEIRVVKCYDKN
ncbi:hypothetical protein BACCAP_03611 [Pseudoflavonifractor capillosus ATCC 29799]|uniref:Uncharacterized protein n=1 Tax=Pseudoflavonifractor capillosus ATCC 29799 TaxID=411467 RepID=A6NZG0_9FIRM|nr:hypothetical protein BACCAP_03611 [Pseudoflavonifractor capillosus ATCC 29799]